MSFFPGDVLLPKFNPLRHDIKIIKSKRSKISHLDTFKRKGDSAVLRWDRSKVFLWNVGTMKLLVSYADV
jgi:hypothetical protein